MKTHTLLAILFLICGLEITAQVNTTVRSAKCVGEIPDSETIALGSSDNCIGGSVKLYYQFTAVPSVYIPSPNVGVWTISTGTFTYNVYGPFTDIETAHTQVELGLATPRATSASPSNVQTMLLGGPVSPGQIFMVEITLSTCAAILTTAAGTTTLPSVSCQPISLECEDCLGQFQPTEGKYVFSAWTKEVGADVTKTSYTYPSIEIETFDGVTTTPNTFNPVGDIIDGWQQITGTFDIPADMETFELQFIVGGSTQTALFDDIRIFPFDGSMMSYVYDPVTLRLVAELDERNYAKLYEYDEEGKLVRVKKETEKGILTITENRENSVKKP